MKRIVLTGGGTAGHVTPNIALLDGLKQREYEIRYIGSYDGIEKTLIEKEGISYDGISSGKLRRYFNIKNFSDPFRVGKGFFQAHALLKKFQPDVVFSKGGFVAVPVVLAAQALHIPTIVHESDMTPGLANKLCIPKADKVCCNFQDTLAYLPKDKAAFTGIPIRKELLNGSRLAGLNFVGFTANRPVLLVVGGSTGSVIVNDAVRNILPELLKTFQVIHLCGRDKKDETRNNITGYVQYEYIREELKDLLAAADLVISRAGANAICELLALRKPNILIPLSKNASRGDQILNAASFARQGFSAVMEEEKLTKESLLQLILDTYEHREDFIRSMEQNSIPDSAACVLQVIDELVNSRKKA